jgi:hypothetical protein
MSTEVKLSRSSGFVTLEMVNSKLQELASNSITKIHYAHTVQEDDVVNHMPYNTGLYYSSFEKDEQLPLAFIDDVQSCKSYK